MTDVQPALITCAEPTPSVAMEVKTDPENEDTDLNMSSSPSPAETEDNASKPSTASVHNDLLCFLEHYHSKFDKSELTELVERNFDESRISEALDVLRKAVASTTSENDETATATESSIVDAADTETDTEALPVSQRLLAEFDTVPADKLTFQVVAREATSFDVEPISVLPKAVADVTPLSDSAELTIDSGNYSMQDVAEELQKCNTDPHETILSQLVNDVKNLKKIVAKLNIKPEMMSRPSQTECSSSESGSTSSSGYASGLCIDECNLSTNNRSTTAATSPESPATDKTSPSTTTSLTRHHHSSSHLPRKSAASSLEQAVQRMLKRASSSSTSAHSSSNNAIPSANPTISTAGSEVSAEYANGGGPSAPKYAALDQHAGKPLLNAEFSLPPVTGSVTPNSNVDSLLMAGRIKNLNRRITDTPTRFAMSAKNNSNNNNHNSNNSNNNNNNNTNNNNHNNNTSTPFPTHAPKLPLFDWASSPIWHAANMATGTNGSQPDKLPNMPPTTIGRIAGNNSTLAGLLTTTDSMKNKLPGTSPLFPFGLMSNMNASNPPPASTGMPNDTGMADWLKTYWTNLMQHNTQHKGILDRFSGPMTSTPQSTPPTSNLSSLASLLQLNNMLNNKHNSNNNSNNPLRNNNSNNNSLGGGLAGTSFDINNNNNTNRNNTMNLNSNFNNSINNNHNNSNNNNSTVISNFNSSTDSLPTTPISGVPTLQPLDAFRESSAFMRISKDDSMISDGELMDDIASESDVLNIENSEFDTPMLSIANTPTPVIKKRNRGGANSGNDGEIKPYACQHENCTKTFANKFLLKKHEFIHSGLRPHQCPFCHKRFNRKDNLLRHKKTHVNNALQSAARRRHSTVFGVNPLMLDSTPDLSGHLPSLTSSGLDLTGSCLDMSGHNDISGTMDLANLPVAPPTPNSAVQEAPMDFSATSGTITTTISAEPVSTTSSSESPAVTPISAGPVKDMQALMDQVLKQAAAQTTVTTN